MTHALYALTPDGAVPRWLALGVHTAPLTHLADHVRADGSPFGERGRWALNFWAFDPEVADLKLRAYRGLTPDSFQLRESVGGQTAALGAWRFARTGDDQVIDFSRFNFTPTLMEAALACALESPDARTVRAELLTIGPARLWHDGALVADDGERFSYVALRRIPLTLDLRAGLNPITLWGGMLGWREARLAIGLRLHADDSAGVRCAVPIGEHDADGWLRAEAAVDAAHLRAFAFPTLPAKLYCDDDAPGPITVDASVTIPIPDTPWARLIGVTVPTASARLTLAPGESADLPLTPALLDTFARIPGEGALRLSLTPVVDDGAFAGELTRHLDLWASASAYSHDPYGTYDERLAEARRHLAAMLYDVPSSLAAIAIGRAERLDSAAVAVACAFLDDRADCADFYAVGLLAALCWHGDSPAIAPDDQAKIETSLRAFKYWIDEPGIDGMCYFTENHQMLFHVCAYLVGQLHPDWTFSNSGLTGEQQRRKAVPQIARWIATRLEGGFSEWDSNAYLTLDAFALLALVEFARDAQIADAAARLLDAIFASLAEQTYRGALGTSHGRCYVSALKSARVENTSPLCRIAFGMGQFNGETRATALLALSRRYRVPEMIQRRGAAVGGQVSLHHIANGTLALEHDMKDQAWHVETLTERTPDGMVSAAIDVSPAVPGAMGIQEHLWQITLTPEASVFTTYPGNAQEHGNARPNYWAGSARLPRVAMRRRAVVCLYQVDPAVGMGFTHAWFPCSAFEEWTIDGQWAFGRVGLGYVALWGDGPLVLTRRGVHAWQEIRSGGAGAAWAACLGRYADDGSFAAFRARLTGFPPVVIPGGLAWGGWSVTG